MASANLPIFTIGHSTRPLEEFIGLLHAQGITRLVDIRAVPRSRRNPQYNRETLPDALQAEGIGYLHMPGLGGLRHPQPDSINTGWENESFRGFADYMQSPEFEENLRALIDLTRHDRIAIMCAEAVPWRCHRSLVADALIVRDIPVEDIISGTRTEPRSLTPFARAEGTRITYPPEG
jgi:uncharacterized protein (DUF488 family)